MGNVTTIDQLPYRSQTEKRNMEMFQWNGPQKTKIKTTFMQLNMQVLNSWDIISQW